MTLRLLRNRGIGWVLGTAIVLAPAGCSTDDAARATRPGPDPAAPEPVIPLEPGGVGVSRTANVRSAVLPLGAVPYDNMTLPVVSPDGARIVTEVGAPPSWSTVLARTDAGVPLATRLEIYQLNRGGEPTLAATVTEPVLLGRGCDAAGFLVEAPQSDGARWIGKAAWDTGAITWLVRDEHVNAFASLGPGGRLAWSRRAIDENGFRLVVRGGGDEWTIGTPGEDWLLPTWAGRGDGLFAFRLQDTSLEAVFGSADDPVAYQQSLQRLSIGRDARVSTAFQTANGQVGVVDLPAPQSQLLFFHPVVSRAAVWRPLAPGGRSARLFPPKSFYATVAGDSSFALVSTDTDLVRQRLLGSAEAVPLLRGTLVSRPTADSEWPFILLAPKEGRIGLTAMRLLPADAPLSPR